MNYNSLQENEQFIVETMLSCSFHINKVSKNSDFKLKSFQLFENNRYLKPLDALFESVTGNKFNGVKDPNIPLFENFRNNQYAYFNNVNDILVNYNPLHLVSLNESINNDETNIDSFLKDLSYCIKELETIDDFIKLDTLQPEIRKIKIWAKKPIYVFGFDIVSNYHLRQELYQKYNLKINELISLLFDKTNKQLIFVFNGKVLAYDIKSNNLGFYNLINAENSKDRYTNEPLFINQVDKINIGNYHEFLKEDVNNNLIELFYNIDAIEIKFTDNLYSDNKRTAWLEKNKSYKDTNNFVKIPEPKK